MEAYELLEKEWADYCGFPKENMVVCSSGTSAIHLALESFQFRPGSEVILPDYTMVACARAVVLAGLTPVFVDCLPGDLTMDIDLIRGAITNRTVAILPVSVYGRGVGISELNEEVPGNTVVIEDLAEDPRPSVGTYYRSPDVSCWSFYRNKIVAGEEGGAVGFVDPKRAKLARSLRNMGFTEYHDYTHIPRGHNYRMSNAHAKLVLSSLYNVDVNWRDRIRVAEEYETLCPEEYRMPDRDSPWVYDLRIRGMGVTLQRALVLAIQGIGVVARYGFKPLSSQEEFRGCRVVGSRVAYSVATEVIYLPLAQDGVSLREKATEVFCLIRKVMGR